MRHMQASPPGVPVSTPAEKDGEEVNVVPFSVEVLDRQDDDAGWQGSEQVGLNLRGRSGCDRDVGGRGSCWRVVCLRDLHMTYRGLSDPLINPRDPIVVCYQLHKVGQQADLCGWEMSALA